MFCITICAPLVARLSPDAHSTVRVGTSHDRARCTKCNGTEASQRLAKDDAAKKGLLF